MAETSSSTQITLGYSGSENESDTLEATLELLKYVEATERDKFIPETAKYPWTMTESTRSSRSIDDKSMTEVIYNHVVIQAKHRAQQSVFVELYDAYKDFTLVRILDTETSRPTTFKEMKTYSVVKSDSFSFEKSADISDVAFPSQVLDVNGKVLSGVRYILDNDKNVIHFVDKAGNRVVVSVVLEAWLSRKIDYYSIDRSEFLNVDAEPTSGYLMKTDLIGFNVDYTDWDIAAVERALDEYCLPFMIVLRDTATRKVLDVLITNLMPVVTGTESKIEKLLKKINQTKIEMKPVAYAYSVYTGRGDIIYSAATSLLAGKSKYELKTARSNG